MNHPWYRELVWVAAAGVLGFIIPAVCVRLLHLPREIFLLPYASAALAFLYAYVRWSGIDVAGLFRQHWVWGLVGALALAAFMVRNILSQPASPHSDGLRLAF